MLTDTFSTAWQIIQYNSLFPLHQLAYSAMEKSQQWNRQRQVITSTTLPGSQQGGRFTHCYEDERFSRTICGIGNQYQISEGPTPDNPTDQLIEGLCCFGKFCSPYVGCKAQLHTFCSGYVWYCSSGVKGLNVHSCA